MGRELKKGVTVGEIASILGLSMHGPSDAVIYRVDSADCAEAGSVCFAKNMTWVGRVATSAVLLTAPDHIVDRTGPTLFSLQPRLDFARLLVLLESLAGFAWSDADPMIHPTARIGQNVVLGRGVRIGADTVIHHNIVIGDEVQIGKRCVVKSGAVIGEDGFGFERDSSGKAIRLPHIGTVMIGDDVEIGSLTTVCRGTLGNSVLRDGCKIDDHVHIAHNVDVGEDAFVIACAEVSGGVKIGARSWIAPNASVLNQLCIGADAVVGLGGVVVKSVPDGAVVAGNPAKPLVR
jgi:UDP-3-O-[3-hydroxymyristoyl] glucosamine N-acyltransferase LpxD